MVQLLKYIEIFLRLVCRFYFIYSSFFLSVCRLIELNFILTLYTATIFRGIYSIIWPMYNLFVIGYRYMIEKHFESNTSSSSFHSSVKCHDDDDDNSSFSFFFFARGKRVMEKPSFLNIKLQLLLCALYRFRVPLTQTRLQSVYKNANGILLRP